MFDCQRIVIFDTEWTSWPGFLESHWNQPGRHREIVQLGAVALVVDDGFREVDSFQILVQPKINPVLSKYFIELTGITQVMVNADGISFPESLTNFTDFAGTEPVQFASFGGDENVIEENCGFYGMQLPPLFSNCIDLRKEFLKLNIIEENWYSSDLPDRLGLAPAGNAHDALADSRAISAALRHFGDILN